jgi:ankyrin repeat protein
VKEQLTNTFGVEEHPMKHALMIIALSISLLVGVQAGSADDSEQFLNAAYDGDLATVKSLLGKKPGLISVKDKDGNTALHLASSEDHGEMVQFLLTKGASLAAKNDLGFTPLHKAVWKGRIKIVKILLAKGADVNAKTVTNATPLSIAREAKLACDRKELIDLLKKAGAKD